MAPASTDTPAKNHEKRIKSISLSHFFLRLTFWSVLPILLISILLATNQIYHLKKINDESAANLADNVMAAIDRQIETQIAALQMLATSPLLDETPDLSRFYNEASSFHHNFVGHVILADLSTQMIFNTRLPFGVELPKLPQPKGRAAAPTVIESYKPAVGDMFLGPIAKEPMIAVVVPVIRTGKIRYLLLSIIPTSHFQQSLDSVTLPAGFSLSVLDGMNTVMAVHSQHATFRNTAGQKPSNRLRISSAITPWSVELKGPGTLYSKPVMGAFTVLFSAILVVMLMSIFVARIFGRHLITSLVSLVDKPTHPGSNCLRITEVESIRRRLGMSIEAQKKAETVLSASEDKFKHVFESANVGKSITLPTGEIAVNRAFAEMLGYSKEELSQAKWQELTPPEEIEKIQKILEPLLQGTQDSARFSKRYIHKNGSYVWADVSLAIRRGSDNHVLYLIATIVDITEQKKFEQQLANALHYIQTIFDKSPIGIATIKADGQILTTNPSLAQIVGGTIEKILTLNIHEIESWRTSGMLAAAQESFKTGIEQNVDFQHMSSFGKDCWVSCSFIPFLHEGEQQLLLLVTDISQRKQAEQEREKLQTQLQQAQKIEAVGQLAGGVAHDYNNALSVIIGFTEMTMDDMDPAGELYANLSEVLAAANRSADITRQLLAFARQQTISPRVLDLNTTIENMLKMLHRLIGEDINLKWLPGTDVWAIKIDPFQIDQILANLCINARDAIEGVGNVTIETKNLSFDENYCVAHQDFIAGDYVLLAVSDDGCGMTAETIEKIFEPFFTTKALHEGTGLGLATIYGIVKQNNGFINVYSEPGKGTTFKIYLTRHTGESVDTYTEGSLEIPLCRGETILLVEDDDALLQLGKRMLADIGYTVLPANSPGKALKLAEQHTGEISLLLTDVIMPEMNGRELSKHLQRLHPHLKILFTSGYTANVIAHRGVLDEDVCFISKPFLKKDLALKVREVLDGTH